MKHDALRNPLKVREHLVYLYAYSGVEHNFFSQKKLFFNLIYKKEAGQGHPVLVSTINFVNNRRF